MPKDDSVPYIRCYTCGRYIPEPSAMKELFCSRDCLNAYLHCPACGEYYPREDDRFNGYCSEICRSAAEDKKGFE